jgi:hypothetical protein
MYCPTCGAGVMEGAKFCNNCGKATTAGAPVAATVPSRGGFGGYAAAAAPAPVTGPRAHAEGNRLIVPKANPGLPAFCVKCGQPAAKRIHRKITWMNPAIYLLCLFGLIGIILAVIIQAIVGKKIELDVPLCDADASARTRNIWIGVALTFAVPIALPILAAMMNNDSLMATAVVAAIVSFIAGVIVWVVAYNAISVKKVDDVQGEFKVSPAFLEKLG